MQMKDESLKSQDVNLVLKAFLEQVIQSLADLTNDK